MSTKSWLLFALLGAAGLPLAAHAGWQCAGGPKTCAVGNSAAGKASTGRSSPQPAAQESTAAAGTAAQGNPGIVPINSRITTVKTYAELGAEWWQWALQAPAADSPLADATGKKCSVGQAGPVWFLAGTLGGTFHSGDPTVPTQRTCQVPFGKAIFFPVINAALLGFLSDPPEQRTAEFVRGAAEAICNSDSIVLNVTIDERAVARPARYVTSGEDSPVFQVQLPTDNILGATPADIPQLMLSPSAHKGFYIYLRPLAPGHHTVAWEAAWVCSFGEFSENVSYTLEVLPGITGEE